MTHHFADIILPLAVKGRYTYRIPERFLPFVRPGVKAVVPFGSRNIYTGIVSAVHDNPPAGGKIRDIADIPGYETVVTPIQLRFWEWIASYYMCTGGEVMKAALPGAIIPDGLQSSGVNERYRPRQETFVALAGDFSEKQLNTILDSLGKAPRQAGVLESFLAMTGYPDSNDPAPVKKSLLIRKAGASSSHIDTLVREKILSYVTLDVSRLATSESPVAGLNRLSLAQETAYASVCRQLAEKKISLLHGVTSSGKTEIYIHLISEQLKKGKQVLYMLPEIALTTQIIMRLRKYFGAVTGVYHSRFNDQEKVEIWKKVSQSGEDGGYRLILGVRSALFLPFTDLGLVIVDEEHDGSYKQHDPAPRYHARDSAIVLASMHNASTVLGSATPSMESYFNAMAGKYGLTELNERHGAIKLPSIVIADTREAARRKLMTSHFTPQLLHAIDNALGNREQVILFQNRRGFSSYVECSECGWIPSCTRCAVSLTYHKGINRLVCHYCGYETTVPARCGSCSSPGMLTRGFGTEKIEDEIKIVFPSARVARLDQDTTRKRNSFSGIIEAFARGDTDILIGTQMISKGLDFENLTVVGILNADNLLNFPDFRAHERSYQLIEQVSGRAGRRQKQGTVVIQTSDPRNRIIRLVLNHDYRNLFRLQSEERKTFNYPPFCRMVRIIVRHHERSQLDGYAGTLGNELKHRFGNRVLGPEYPLISQVQLWYIKNILVKIERERPLAQAKDMIADSIEKVMKEKGASSLRIAVDVDPY